MLALLHAVVSLFMVLPVLAQLWIRVLTLLHMPLSQQQVAQ
jgi:hypothetical protein